MAELLQIRARRREGEPEGGEEGTNRPSGPKLREQLSSAARIAMSVWKLGSSSVWGVGVDSRNDKGVTLALHVFFGGPLTLAAMVLLAIRVPYHWLDALLARSWGLGAVFAGAALLQLLTTWLATFTGAFVLSRLAAGSRSRVGQALVCPYCRDQVAQDGTVVCARPGCAALYHRECWDECAVQYGGCAIYGCSSKKSREISAAGYLLRLSRLALAALLFPPRMARAIRDRGGDELAPVLRRSFDGAKLWHRATNERSSRQFWIVGVGVVIAAIGAGIFLDDRLRYTRDMSNQRRALIGFAIFYAVPFGLLALPFVVAILTLPVFFTIKALATVFKNELAALGRADEGGGSVLGRLRSGLGGKKDCC